MIVSLRLNKEDEQLIKKYAELKGMSLSDLFRNALIEKIEDEYDNTVCERALKEYEASGRKSRPIEELWQELGI